MCKLVMSGLALFFAGMFWDTWVNVCKHEDLPFSLLITMAVGLGFMLAICIAEAGDVGLNWLKEKIHEQLELRRQALSYLVELKKREEVPNDWPSNL